MHWSQVYLGLGPGSTWAKVQDLPFASSIWLPWTHSPAGEQTRQAVQTVGLKTSAAGSSAVVGSFGNSVAVGNSAVAGNSVAAEVAAGNSEVVAAGNSGTSAAALAFASLHWG